MSKLNTLNLRVILFTRSVIVSVEVKVCWWLTEKGVCGLAIQSENCGGGM